MNTSQFSTVYLALGSNRGDRMANLSAAIAALEKDGAIHAEQTSKIYETEPWPREAIESGPGEKHPSAERGKDWFLNQVIRVSTSLMPHELLARTQAIEKALGRMPARHWGPRVIDIDILLFGDEIVDTPGLTLPHPHIESRRFVLVPLLEIAPELEDPITGARYRDILDSLKDDHEVVPFL